MKFYQRILKKFNKELLKMKKGRLEIILYHFVSDENNIFTGFGHNVKPVVFREQIKYLSENYTIISFEQAKNVIINGYKGPYVSICFDDGYSNNIIEAYPILEEFKIPATIFICPSVLGNRDLLWRDKIRYIINSNLTSQFIDFLKKCDNFSKYNFSLSVNNNFYGWSKKASAITDMSIQDDLNDFFKFKNIKAPEIAAQCNLYIKKSDIGEFKYLSFGNHTWSHPLMTCLDFYKQEEEILKAHKYLEEVEISPCALSLPFAPYRDCRQLSRRQAT